MTEPVSSSWVMGAGSTAPVAQKTPNFFLKSLPAYGEVFRSSLHLLCTVLIPIFDVVSVLAPPDPSIEEEMHSVSVAHLGPIATFDCRFSKATPSQPLKQAILHLF